MRRRHERGRLLMTSQDELDPGLAKRLDYVKILFPRYSEDSIDAFVFQRSNK
jgi:hypothetical protein